MVVWTRWKDLVRSGVGYLRGLHGLAPGQGGGGVMDKWEVRTWVLVGVNVVALVIACRLLWLILRAKAEETT